MGGFRLDLGGFMSIPSGLSVIVGPKSLMLSYCCWPSLIVVLLAMPTVPTLFPVNARVLYLALGSQIAQSMGLVPHASGLSLVLLLICKIWYLSNPEAPSGFGG